MSPEDIKHQELRHQELRGKNKLGYSLGTFGIFLLRILISTFIFQFYVYTINLASLYVSIGVSVYLIISALFSILWGVVIDKKKPGKRGRRRPFLLIGLPLWIISNIIIWIPPFYCPQENTFYLPTAIFFWIVMVCIALSDTLLYTAYLAMFPEQFQSKKARSSVATMQGIFLIISSIIALLLPLIIQNLVDPEKVKWWESSGKIMIFWIPIIGILSTSLAVITILLVYISVDESHYSAFTYPSATISLRKAFHQILPPLKDKKYRKFLSVQFFNHISSNILGVAIIPFLTYVLKFRESEFFIYILLSTIAKISWYVLFSLFFQKKELKQKYSFCIIAAALSSFVVLLYLFDIKSYIFNIILFVVAIGTILGTLYAYPLFSTPLGAILVYDAAKMRILDKTSLEEKVSEISGSYYGSLNFSISLGKTLGSILMGVLFIGSNQQNPVIITLSLGSMGVFYLISFLSLKKMQITEKMEL
ncbi:MAG: conserved membrane protein of unknown function [Promethearchaeota archaeon]|nr:MAG: conserved membrane protein of unknown function [Candidatus Lokiarchaeota archaeon]